MDQLIIKSSKILQYWLKSAEELEETQKAKKGHET